ncbi:MAG: DUF192 domain-containing protein [Pseudonocardiaceae bacterium]
MIRAARRHRPAIAFLAVVRMAACRPATPVEGLPRGTLLIEGTSGEVQVEVAIAETDESKSQGLMGVEEMDPDSGMVFLQDDPARISFWMKDTLIPLSIAFWGPDRRIATILDMDPCRTNTCPTYDPEIEWVGALEVNQGFFAERGIEEGAPVRLERS